MKKHWRWVIGVFIVTSIFLSACGPSNELVYSVEGEATEAEISYLDTEGNEILEMVSLPWQKSFKVSNDADYALSATRISDGKDITCAVTINEKTYTDKYAKFIAECKGNFNRKGKENFVESSTRADALELLIPFFSQTIQGALESETLSKVDLTKWDWEVYNHETDCTAIRENSSKISFAVRHPSRLGFFPCGWADAESDYARFFVTPISNDGIGIRGEVFRFQHSITDEEALQQAWSLIEAHAKELEVSGKGMRINQSGSLIYKEKEAPFLDTIESGNSQDISEVFLSRLVYLISDEGEGIGFVIQRSIRSSVTEAFAELDALSRSMIESVTIN